MKTIDTILKEEVTSMTQALFERYDIKIEEDQNNENNFNMIAIIGFSGKDIKGSLGFAAAENLIHESYYGETLNPEMIDDWLGEIANQLLGRLKNILLVYGLDVHLSTPMVLHGLNITVGGGSKKIHRTPFKSNMGNSAVWVKIKSLRHLLFLSVPYLTTFRASRWFLRTSWRGFSTSNNKFDTWSSSIE